MIKMQKIKTLKGYKIMYRLNTKTTQIYSNDIIIPYKKT